LKRDPSLFTYACNGPIKYDGSLSKRCSAATNVAIDMPTPLSVIGAICPDEAAIAAPDLCQAPLLPWAKPCCSDRIPSVRLPSGQIFYQVL